MAHQPPAMPSANPAAPSDDVHAVADQKADHRDSEEQDRDEREEGENPRLEPERCDLNHPPGLTAFRPKWTTVPSRRRAADGGIFRCRSGVAITVHRSLVLSWSAL